MSPAATNAPRSEVAAYYRCADVHHRIEEYLTTPGEGASPTAAALAGLYPGCCAYPMWERAPSHPVADLDALLDRGADIARSMLDSQALVVHVDLDYQNSSRPEEPFLHAAETFERIEPAYAAAGRVLARFALRTLVLMTGRGYHFTGCVPLDAPIVDDVAALWPGEPRWYATRVERTGDARAAYEARTGRAYAGLGLLAEYLAQEILREGARGAPLPFVLNGTVVGHVSRRGRECVSVDVSFCGDPVDVRSIRCAFSSYQLHRLRPDIFGAAAAAQPPLAAVPRAGALDEMFGRRSLAGAAATARESRASMPVCSTGLAHLLEAYRKSDLARFHARFHATPPYAPADWPRTYDRFDFAPWPACVTAPLRRPNDLLLQPACLQHVTRALLDAGWEAGHIAGLVWSRYARDHAWGDRWTRRMDARTRAEFDVRVFAGLIAAGLDHGIDFNCVSAREKGVCPGRPCDRDLRDLGRRLRGSPAP